MTAEALFIEKWKELEHATHLAFPTWNGHDVEKFLKLMRVEGVDFTRIMALRKVRNALTHNTMMDGHPIVTVNEAVIPFIDSVVSILKHLPTAENIMILRHDVYSCSFECGIGQVVDVMLDKVFSHVPVLDANGRVVGVFSESTMLQIDKAGIRNDGTMRMCDIAAFLPMERHTAEVFRFAPRNDSIAHLRHLCADALEKHERIGIIFVTENGRPDEPLLGILTVWDIAGVTGANSERS